MTDEEIVLALFLHAGKSSVQPFAPEESIEALTYRVEEADNRLVLHCAWEVDRHIQ